MMYLTVALRLLRWPLQSDYLSWGNQWVLCWWCPMNMNSLSHTYGHYVIFLNLSEKS